MEISVIFIILQLVKCMSQFLDLILNNNFFNLVQDTYKKVVIILCISKVMVLLDKTIIINKSMLPCK